MPRGRHMILAVAAGSLALAGWPGRPAAADTPDKLPANLQVTATNLSPGWMTSTIGTTDTIAEPQSVSVDSNGVMTLVASGKDLWNSDDGGLIVYMKHTGDGSVSFHLISQMGGQDASGTDTGWVKTSASFRESLDSAARDVRIDASSGNMLLPTARVNAGDTPLHPGDAGTQGVGFTGPGNDMTPNGGRPIGSGVWLGVDRHGDVFSFYWSNDGKVWTKIAGLNLQLPADVLAGVEASAHKDDPTDKTIPPQTSKLDNLSVSSQLLAPQSIQNIGYMGMDKSALVTWTPVALAAGDVTYNVYMIDPANVQKPTKLTATPIKEASFLVPNLTNGSPYLFGVSAVVNGVESGIQLPEPNASAQNHILPSVVPGPPVFPGFTLVDIGTASPGTVTLTSGTDLASAAIHMKASGWDIYQAADGFSFLAMPMSGDLDVSARFVKGPTEDTDGGGWELGGPMFRETLDAGSRFVMAQIAATQQLQFKRRETQYATPVNTGVDFSDNTNQPRPVTMRVVRKGDTFQGYYSLDDGKTWKDLGDPTMSDPGNASASKDTLTGFSKTPWVGIALSGHTEGEFTEADIDHLVIKPAQ